MLLWCAECGLAASLSPEKVIWMAPCVALKPLYTSQASWIFTDFNVTHAMWTNALLCTDKKLWGDRATFKIRLKTLLFHKAYRVRSGSGEAEPSLSCASVGSGCWGTFWAIFPFTLDVFIHHFCMSLHFVYSFTWFVLSSCRYALPFPPPLLPPHSSTSHNLFLPEVSSC